MTLRLFIAFSQDDEVYTYLMNGYTEVVDLSEEDLYAIELMGLFVILRFLGKKSDHPSRDFWFVLAQKQLLRVNKLETEIEVKSMRQDRG